MCCWIRHRKQAAALLWLFFLLPKFLTAFTPMSHATLKSKSMVSSPLQSSRGGKYPDDNYYSDDNYYNDYNDDDDDDDEGDYWEDETSRSKPKSNYYNVYFDDPDESLQIEKDKIEWELCEDGATWVILPPPYVLKPTATIHFVGGTFFGSSPNLWYRSLLESLVRATQCTIVATAIPATLLESPLQHVTLARKLQHQFQNAFLDVLEDEYGKGVMQEVPVVAMGHSLGARLMAVLTTLAPLQQPAAPSIQACILISFTNLGASVSIPGVKQLLQSRLSLNKNDNSNGPRQRRRRQQSTNSRGNRRNAYFDDYDYDDYDDSEDLDAMMNDLKQYVSDRTSRVRDALTPQTEDLEFHPRPDQLWDALGPKQRYTIPQTLLVQFDGDEVDQTAILAQTIRNTTDVRYCRLRGFHLTPISVVEGHKGDWLEFPTRAAKAIGKLARIRNEANDNAMKDLRRSIVRYIMDIVVASPSSSSSSSSSTSTSSSSSTTPS